MEITAMRPFSSGSVKRYLRRREYKRLHDEIAEQKRGRVARFGRGGPRRFWKIRLVPRLRWRIVASPLKLLAGLKNAYVRTMFSLAGNVGSLNTNNVFGAKRIPKARQAPTTVYSAEEIENRLIYEIYLALKASQPDLPAAAAPAAAPAPALLL